MYKIAVQVRELVWLQRKKGVLSIQEKMSISGVAVATIVIQDVYFVMKENTIPGLP